MRGEIHALTGGAGVDIVIDPLGGKMTEAALRALAWRGRLVVVGFAAGGAFPTLRTNYLLLKNIEVSGLQISDYRKRQPALLAQCFAELFALWQAGKIRPAPVTWFALDGAGTALARLRERKLDGRAVLRVRSD